MAPHGHLRCLVMLLLFSAGTFVTSSSSRPGAVAARSLSTTPERCFLGCFTDTYEGRALRKYFYHQDREMTIETCQQAAKTQNYSLFSLQNARECWGSRHIAQATQYGNSDHCNQTCTGNSSETCGGWLAYDLYALGPCPAPSFVSTVTTYPPAYIDQPLLVQVGLKNLGGPLTAGIVDFEVFDSAGTRVNQQYVLGQDFSAGATRGYNFTWQAANVGSYTVKLGVFKSDWSSFYYWNSSAAVVAVGTSCKVRVQFNTYWSESEWQTTFMNIYVTNSGPFPILNPWNFTLYNPTYSGQFQAWNLQRSSFSVRNHTYSGTSEDWLGDLPAGGPEVYMLGFNTISSFNYDFLPTTFTINGQSCVIVRSP